MIELIFYIFASILILSSLMVVINRNPVHSVLFLILAFFNAAGLFVLIGAEFIAMLLVVVYVGAVAVLFLFVIMMLNVNVEKSKYGFQKYLPLGIILALVIFIEMFFAFSHIGQITYNGKPTSDQIITGVTNTHQIGLVLYTKYVLAFQISGLILFVAMIGAIVLTFTKENLKHKQNIAKQVLRSKDEAIEVKHVKTGAGVDL